MVISCLYVQTIIRQCFCFPNSQWGATAHDTSLRLCTVWFAPPPEPGIQWVWAVKRPTTLGTITMIETVK